MLNQEEAKKIVEQKLRKESYMKKPGMEFVIDESATIECEYGWIFFYQTKLYVETKQNFYRHTGCFPILVDKVYEILIDIFDPVNLQYCIKKYGETRGEQLYKVPEDTDLFELLTCYLRNTQMGGFPNERAAIEYYIQYTKPAKIQDVIEQVTCKLQKKIAILTEINKATNRNFNNEEQARKWLKKVIDLLEILK